MVRKGLLIIALVAFLSGCGPGLASIAQTTNVALQGTPTATYGSPSTATYGSPPTASRLTATATHTPTPKGTSPPQSRTAIASPVATVTPRPPVTLALPPAPDLGDTWTRPMDRMVMVYVPSGQFVMGSDDEMLENVLVICNEIYRQLYENAECKRSYFEHEQPPHTVLLDAFWIDQTEVSNAQFAAFLNEWGNQVEGPDRGPWLNLDSDFCQIELVGGEFVPKNGYADHPVSEVTWYGAAGYCAWVGGRLSTEAEWEYAARGPDGLVYPWGDTFDGSRMNYCDVNCSFKGWPDTAYDDGHAQTAPVGSYPRGASWRGALSLAGNVSEWVSDWYDEDYYAYSPINGPRGPDEPDFWYERVVRGGSWVDYSFLGRSTHRGSVQPSEAYLWLGFRCAASAGP